MQAEVARRTNASQTFVRRLATRALPLLIPAGLIVGLFISFGHIGYSPSDEGNILAQTHRILHGQVPHRDFIFARPVGSALLHMIDFALPMPRFEAARLIGITEIVLYSFLFSKLLFRLPLIRWTVFHYLGATGATLVNLHTFPLMGWYTTDGLLCVAIGLVLVDAGVRLERTRFMWFGMVALGFAPMMKQSFVVAPLIGMAYIAWRSRSSDGWVRRTLVAATAGAAPLVAYLVVVAALGAGGAFLHQLAGAEPVWGKSFFTPFTEPITRVQMAVFLMMAVVGFVMVFRTRDRSQRGRTQPVSAGSFGLRAAVSTLLVITPILQKFDTLIAERFDLVATWGIMLTWALVAFLVVKALFERVPDAMGIAFVVLAWMTALSWGNPSPNLVAGTLLLFLLQRVWSGIEVSSRTRVLAIGSAAAVLATVGAFVVLARNDRPYYDKPRGELTEALRDVSPEFGGIRTSLVTATYLRQLRACIEKYPARWVAFLPDNPGIYAALNLRNPFPIDWMYANEVEAATSRIVQSARQLDRDGDFLVMFQTFSFVRLALLEDLPQANARSQPFFYDTAAGRGIIASLHGERATCGSFVGTYRSRSLG